MATINTNISIAIATATATATATETPSLPAISATKPNAPLLPSFPCASSSSSSSSSSSEHGDYCNEEEVPFTPYSAELPWHTGPRAILSHLFPKYGHYCGPNWSSGRSHGPLLWNLRPIDSLDHCCFCHDVGYDTHDQARLYKADLQFLDCLSKIPDSAAKKLSKNPRHESPLSRFYRTACIIGLKTVLLPYRRMLLQKIEEEEEEAGAKKKKKVII